MKTVLKIAFLFAIILGFKFTAQANNPIVTKTAVSGDSVIVNFGKGGKMVILFKDKDDLEELKAVDFNKLIAEMSTYIDSAKNSPDGTYTIRTDQGEFKIYTEEVEEDDDDSFSISIGEGIYIGKSSKKDEWERKKETRRTRSFTDFYIGLNGYLQDGNTPTGSYELRPWGSRYFEFAFKRETRLSANKDAKFFLNYGIGFSWYNFMLEGDERFVKQSDGTIGFETILDENNDAFTLRKTKLTTSFVNVPMMLMFKTNDFRLGLGGYVGYRLGSHTKVKYLNEAGDWTKDKDFGNFNLTNFRYGVQTEIGVSGITLFGKYDLNNLFRSDSGTPELNAFAFGIRL